MAFLPGFDERWADAPDFIHGITRELWDQRRFELLDRYLNVDLVLRTPMGVVQGNRRVGAEIQATVAEFPDIAPVAEDVIWSVTGYKSFLASQRLFINATHDGGGVFGPPTGKSVQYRVQAMNWCQANAIHEAWHITDHGAIVRQLGHDLTDWTRALIVREGGIGSCTLPFFPDADLPSRYEGRGNDSDWGHTLADLLSRIASGEMGLIAQHFDPAIELAYPGMVTGTGQKEAERFWIALRSAMPSARFKIEQMIGMEETLCPPRAAVRWSLQGRHDGWGAFGAPSGAELYVMGITHAEFGPRGLRRDWTLFDEVAIQKQILVGSGAV